MKIVMKTRTPLIPRHAYSIFRRKETNVDIHIHKDKLYIFYWQSQIHICFSHIKDLIYNKKLRQLKINGFNESTEENLHWNLHISEDKERQLLSHIETIMNIKIVVEEGR